MPKPSPAPSATELLRTHFGHAAFREGQERVVEAIIAGRSALALFPTGAGKSLCYQLPALVRGGAALIVSPLIALMKDQVETLRRRGIAAARLDSTLSAAEVAQVYQDMASGALRLLYIAPERLSNETFTRRLRTLKVSLLAIDEAHCISEWGHNFRPDYLRLAAVAREMRLGPVLALTATATPETAADIRAAFDIVPENHVQTSFHRANLYLQIVPAQASERMALLTKELKKPEALPAIVYVTLQETAEHVATQLQRAGITARAYHAGMTDPDRAETQDLFMSGACPVIVATIAFGMGIDKADIRSVFHYNLPKTLENYMQETGRAGRDGERSVCTLFACAADRIVLENFACGQTPSVQAVRSIVDHLLRHTGPEFDISRYELAQATDTRPIVLETILAFLEMEGVLTPVGAFPAGYRVSFGNSEERILAGHTPARQHFLRALFASGKRGRKYLTLDIAEAAAATGGSGERVRSALQWLTDAGDIQTQPANYRHRFRLHHTEAAPSPGVIAEKLAQRFVEREARDVERLEEVLTFAAHPGCLTQFLLRRFGEEMPAPCGHCGNCVQPREGPLEIPGAAVPEITAEDVTAIHALHAERHMALRSGRQLARFLCGITSPAVTRSKLTRHDAFGMLTGVPFHTVLAQTESLTGES